MGVFFLEWHLQIFLLNRILSFLLARVVGGAKVGAYNMSPSLSISYILRVHRSTVHGVRSPSSVAILAVLALKGESDIGGVAEELEVCWHTVRNVLVILEEAGFVEHRLAESSGVARRRRKIYRLKP